MKPLPLAWTKDLPAERKGDFEKTLRNNTLLLKRQLEIITGWENTILSEERSKTQYQTPAWRELQAHRNGNLEIIQKLKDLISIY